jgi:hypothetical protein
VVGVREMNVKTLMVGELSGDRKGDFLPVKTEHRSDLREEDVTFIDRHIQVKERHLKKCVGVETSETKLRVKFLQTIYIF